jgi:Rod binding domain-containing protein
MITPAMTPAAMRRAAQEFEAQALGAMFQPLFEGLSTSGPLGGGAAEAQWRPMMVDAIARDLARAGGLGLADAVLREMTRLQEAANKAEEERTP